jgi:glycosyltransferase involved in cell wall biosynthesis
MIIFQLVNNIALDSIGGGAELFAIRLLEQLQTHNDCHLVIVWRYNLEYETKIVNTLEPNIKVHFLTNNSERNIKNFYLIIKRLNQLIYIHSPQIINSHSSSPDILNSIMKLRFGKNIKTIRTVHTDINWFDSPLLEKILGNYLFPIIFDLEIAISRATLDRLNNRIFTKIFKTKSFIVYNGIPKKIIGYKEKVKKFYDEKQNSRKPINIIAIGRLSTQKGYKYLLEALSLLKEKINFNLYIFGEGQDKDSLKQQAQMLNITNSVKFMGFHDDVLGFMAGCDLFVSSSLWEGFPTVILEAMAVGIPVVATDVSGSRELVVNNITGLLVTPKQSNELAKAIYKIITSPDTAKKFTENATKNLQEFTIERTANKYSKIYSDLL